jgi:hypothetical protein
VFRITHAEGFCDFGFTGKTTMEILTLIFKTLVPDWPVILDFKAIRDVSNVIEIPMLTTWEPEHDMSHDT